MDETDAKSAAQRGNPARDAFKTGHGATVLVVDDDDDTRATFSDILRDEGYRVLAAPNGKAALEMVVQNPRPDVVLLDLSMPVMNGREFLAAVRSDARLASLPVIVLSADIEQTPKGALHAIRKPVGIAALTKLFGWMEELLSTPN